MQPEKAWTSLAKRFGKNLNEVSGTTIQPINIYEFDLDYQSLEGKLSFCWTQHPLRGGSGMLRRGTGLRFKISDTEPVFQLQLFQRHWLFSVFSRLNPKWFNPENRKLGKAFTLLANNKETATALTPFLLFLLDERLNQSLYLDSVFEDGVNPGYYLNVQINLLLLDLETLEFLLAETASLAKEISRRERVT